jgi:hypothetical protein
MIDDLARYCYRLGAESCFWKWLNLVTNGGLAAVTTSTGGRQPNSMQKLVAGLRVLDEQNDRGADRNAEDKTSHVEASLILMPNRRALSSIRRPGYARFGNQKRLLESPLQFVGDIAASLTFICGTLLLFVF